MLAAGLLARNAVARGLRSKPWVKTSLAPGSLVVTEYLDRAGLTEPLEQLGFNLVGYGCTTCIGNSGPLPDEVSAGGQRRRPHGRLGALGQPQLRGAHQPRREDELPRLAAARRRLRARRHDGRRHRQRTARPRTAMERTCTCATSGRASTRSPRRSRAPCSRTCSAPATPMCTTATTAGARWRCRPAIASCGRPSPPTCASRPTSRTCPRSPSRWRTCGAHACSRSSATASRPITSRRPGRSSATGRPGAICRSTAWRRATSTPTGRAAATTR